MNTRKVGTTILLILALPCLWFPARAQQVGSQAEFREQIRPFIGTWSGTFRMEDNSGFIPAMDAVITARYVLDSTLVWTDVVMTDGEGTEVKSVALYGWDTALRKVVRFSANQAGELSTFIGEWVELEQDVLRLTAERTTSNGRSSCVLSLSFPAADSLLMEYCWQQSEEITIKGHITASRR